MIEARDQRRRGGVAEREEEEEEENGRIGIGNASSVSIAYTEKPEAETTTLCGLIVAAAFAY